MAKKQDDFMPLLLIAGGAALLYFMFPQAVPAAPGAPTPIPRILPPTYPKAAPFARGTRDYVRWFQNALNKILGAAMPVDGIIGPITQSAVRQFQSLLGLRIDGIVGPITEMALKQELESPTLWGGGEEDL